MGQSEHKRAIPIGQSLKSFPATRFAPIHRHYNAMAAAAASSASRSMPPLLVKKLSESAVLPVRGSALAAGYDLSAAHDGTIPARGKALIKTDLAMAIPEGCYGRVAPRSGLAWKHSIDVGAGVIDADYRGNVGVILFNFSDKDFDVKAGDRIAQLILERIATPEVEEVEDLDASARGAGGFGSTGGFTAPAKRTKPADTA
jgi:dUTP pyrophosphatase